MAMTKGGLERFRRFVRTVYFMVAMVVSLVVVSTPVAVAVVDILVPMFLVSNFTCLGCYNIREHFHRYTFKGSLTDIPLVSVIRSFIIICAYLMCDGPAISHGPYFGTVMLCSFSSIILLSIKACVFTVNSQIEGEASYSPSRRKLHLKKSWGMPVLFLSSVVFALGHIVVAYRASCRARRKLHFHRVDPEAVLIGKIVFPGFQKVPRSPTPCPNKTSKCDSEMRHKHGELARDEGELPVKFLSDVDSLFITCQGLTVHYKLSMPGSPPHSLSSSTLFDKPNLSTGHTSHKYQFPRSYSNQLCTSSLCDPLIDRSTTSSVLSEEIPVFSLTDFGEPSPLSSPKVEQEFKENPEIGIVLIHGFGGGVFSWRHVMGVLARQVGCTVAAFDRPGWGLTSRPRRKDWEDIQLPNPYSLESQVDLLLSFCAQMGFSSVIFVGHDDGGLLALKAAQRVQVSMNSANVEIKGVVLLGTSLSREAVTGFAKILLRTSVGKKHLVRPLLRTEITQVVNRRAWYDATKLTTEVLSVYKVRPLIA